MKYYAPLIFLSLATAGLNAISYKPFATQSDAGNTKTQAATQPGNSDSTGAFRPGAAQSLS